MDYTIAGVDRKTGKKKTVNVAATSERDALAAAKQLGVAPSAVKPRHHKTAAAKPVPEYRGMLSAGRLLMWFGILNLVIGLAWLIVELIGVARGEGLQGLYLVASSAIFTTGIFQWGAGSGVLALRDIARNSWGQL